MLQRRPVAELAKSSAEQSVTANLLLIDRASDGLIPKCDSALQTSPLRLCVFAPLREPFFRNGLKDQAHAKPAKAQRKNLLNDKERRQNKKKKKIVGCLRLRVGHFSAPHFSA